MNNKTTTLAVNTDVVEKMAEIAAKEVEGVAGLSKKAIDLKGAVKSKNAFKGVKVESVNGALKITVYVCLKQGVHITETAEKVQLNIKEKIQNMTGTAVTQVNVNVVDVEFEVSEEE
ncbi:MAG: Asp23/Gls24 family envelope stress response protein [Clostridia bacterium]|nr:Asp23/Gls24 family envelope stress response protein [Clostridia bacterium]MEE1074216.1 Asp23/Gls24 family envelope stress response protein [Acutalibacteraceae bacterium]